MYDVIMINLSHKIDVIDKISEIEIESILSKIKEEKKFRDMVKNSPSNSDKITSKLSISKDFFDKNLKHI